MKKIMCFLFLTIGLCQISTSQSVTLLKPNEAYKAPPNEEMVVMNKYLFGNFHYTASKYDTLKTNYFKLDSALKLKETTESALQTKYETLISEKQELVNTYENSYQRLNNTFNDCFTENKQLQIDYLKLEQKNKRVKSWRNSFMGITGVLVGIIVLSIVK